MKLALITVLIVLLLAVTACPSGEEHIPIPITCGLPEGGEEAPDDIVGTPGGAAYRANVHHVGEENPWPPIKGTKVTLSSWFREIHVGYRDYIETKAGDTRNNIFYAGRKGGFDEGSRLNLYATSIPPGIELTQSLDMGMIGSLATVLGIEVAPDVAPGQYTFEIGLEISGWDYGTVPCTIRVLE